MVCSVCYVEMMQHEIISSKQVFLCVVIVPPLINAIGIISKKMLLKELCMPAIFACMLAGAGRAASFQGRAILNRVHGLLLEVWAYQVVLLQQP